MPLHPEIAAYLAAQQARQGTAKPTLAELRQGLAATVPPLHARPTVAQVEDRVVPGAAGDIPIRVYTPWGPPPYGLFVFFHGGGWTTGNLETHDVNCRQIVRASGWRVIAVDYRLAPEHPYPAALDDCFTVAEWAAHHVQELQGVPGQLAVGGPSAGGNLAAAVALKARDTGAFTISKQVLLYPATDLDMRHRDRYPSRLAYGQGYGLNLYGERSHPYLRTPEDALDPYVSPMQASDLRGLPSALILTAEYDPLCDEGEAYAFRLVEAGVHVEVKRFLGTIHGFMFHFSELPDYEEGFRLVGAFLRK
ncbi:MAG: alpha/beta hydrolase [Alicyclobacillus sp.]|nr:alpha/beta hydrolase [Alicyclobacillus sp.]